jgi:hypothetical protein
MNFMVGTFLISRFEVVSSLSIGSRNRWVKKGFSCYCQLDFNFETYVVSRFDDYK